MNPLWQHGGFFLVSTLNQHIADLTSVAVVEGDLV
jgi:hypothetical protein